MKTRATASPKAITLNAVLEDMLQTGTSLDANGQRIKLDASALPPREGAFLHRLVARLQPKTVLEIGLAYGTSSLYIAGALGDLEGIRYIVMDPFQEQKYHNIGLHNLQRAGFESVVEFYAESSHRVLPRLEAGGLKLDFAFLDGRHLFDWVLMDFLYVDLMLNVGGVVVLDDANATAVQKVCRFILTNRAYRVLASSQPSLRYAISPAPGHFRLPSPLHMLQDARRGLIAGSRCVAFQKQADDARVLFHHRVF